MRNQNRDVGVSLRRLFPESVMMYAADARARSCTSEFAQVRPGDVYVALDAADFDGHEFVQQAIDRGAESVVVERPVPQTRVPMCLVPDTRMAFGRLCQALAGDPSNSLSCVGVTGTDGKTVTSRLIGSVLREGGAAVGMLDDLCRDQSPEGPVPGAVSSAPEVAAALGEMAASHATHAVLEVSSRALCQRVLSGVALDAACFTNLTRAHLDLHNSAASYRYVKSRLLHHLRAGGTCILNRDDPVCAKLAGGAPGPVLTYGMGQPLECVADVTAEVIERNPAEQSFLLTFESTTVVVRTRLIGDHHVFNCLAAAAVGVAAGIDLASIARGLERVEHLPGRLERIGCGDDPRVFVDIGSTPTALAAALSAARASSDGRLWCVADVPEIADEDELARFGKVMAKLSDTCVVAPAACDEAAMHRCGQLATGFERGERAIVHPNRKEAIGAVISDAASGDVILVVAHRQAGHDRTIIRRALEDRTRERPLPVSWTGN